MNNASRHIGSIVVVLVLAGCGTKDERPANDKPVEAVSLLGKDLFAPDPSPLLIAQRDSARQAYEMESADPDMLIWYGRRTAYLGLYKEAINLFTLGTELFPDDPRFLRHRGHRYISTRQFVKAIDDLKRAAERIEGTDDSVEPDGMPNDQNIPLTTLHSNIWYHLGLAYYLQHDWEYALQAFTICRDLGLNDDNVVSSTHWLYMILRRMGRAQEANDVLSSIDEDMTIIENHSYWKLCLFYKGLMEQKDLLDTEAAAPANDAVRYGIANWHLYSGDSEEAGSRIDEILASPSWNSFGYIAAEADRAAGSM